MNGEKAQETPTPERVALALATLKAVEATGKMSETVYGKGWNACLDEIREYARELVAEGK